MKVCTDACLFGAWIAESFSGKELSILDIGTGTGLLSLMVAQKINGKIDAVEIDEGASEDAHENFESSPWKERLDLFHSGIQEYSRGQRYDLIICNPPFFEGDLKSPDDKRNTALHSKQLVLGELLSNITRLLSDKGHAAVLIADRRASEFEALLVQHNLSVTKKVLVKQTPSHQVFRRMYLLRKAANSCTDTTIEINIREEDNGYSKHFTELLKDYYLYL